MSFWGPFEAVKPLVDFQTGESRQANRASAEYRLQSWYGRLDGIEQLTDRQLDQVIEQARAELDRRAGLRNA